MLNLAHKEIKILVTVIQMFKTSSGVMGDIKETQVKLVEMKATVFEKKNTLDGINIRSDIAEENISELANIVIETAQNEPPRKKGLKNIRRALVSYEDDIKQPNTYAIRALKEGGE